jgi:imidazoleglycerol-phosphate dehydratase/histidinol-phosphatase
MRKALFIDRDGTILVEPEDEQIDSFEKFIFMPGAISGLSAIASGLDYELVMVTNQDGLGTDSFPEDTFWPLQNKMLQILKGEGVVFSNILIDRSRPGDNAPTRKPGTGLLSQYMNGKYDLENSFVIGDRESDLMLAKNLGCKAIFVSRSSSSDAAFSSSDWNEIYRYLKNLPGRAKIIRSTSETNIILELALEGSGKSSINTGIGFFDHMLEQIARHGEMDMTIAVKGDLNTDEHHTIEDVAITLGSAFYKALGNKRGIERYGFVLPMDDSLATIALDFGGRPWLVWDVEFKREKIGEMPTEMFMHFFKSFTDNAKCNLNIKAEGSNEHHKIEAVFKAFAKALKMAVKKTGSDTIPSTKGNL